MTGYRLAQADRARIDPKNLCTKCNNLLREAAQTITCGHRYCKTCIDSVLSQDISRCVADGAVLKRNEVFPDKFVEREILSLVLHCVHHDKGCPWKGELKHREIHERSCELGEVFCVHPECGSLIQRSELADHLQNTCNYRQETCIYCHEMVVVASMTQHHQTSCTGYPVSCHECGRKEIPRCKLSLHLDSTAGDCEEVKAMCPFEAIGCKTTKVMALKERRKHYEEEAVTHVILVLKRVNELSHISKTHHLTATNSANGSLVPLEQQVQQVVWQIEAALKEAKALCSRVHEHDSRITILESCKLEGQLLLQSHVREKVGEVPVEESLLQELSRRVYNQEAKAADLDVFVVDGNRRAEELEQQVTSLKREQEKLKETIQQLRRHNESLEHSLGMRNMTLADLEEYIREQEASSNDGTLVWKLSDFTRKKQDALTGRQVSIYSPCFYTSRYGYKMCARIYLNGDGMGKGTHISVFFVVMRGQYDALLRWPFTQKVTMMLLDQDNVEHVIDSFRPDPNSSSFQRPRREMNVASGCPLFCPLAELSNHAYVRDDTMFFKIIVDTSDL